MLFKLHAGVQLDLNKTACTSKLCAWKKSRKRAHPAPLKEISFKRPKKDENLPNVPSPFKGVLTGFTSPDPVKFSSEKRTNRLKQLKELVSNAVVFKSISVQFGEPENSPGEETSTADENETNILPELLTSFFKPSATNNTNDEVIKIGKCLYNDYLKSSTKNQYFNLTEVTQSLTDTWMLYRAGRITA